MMDNKNSKFRLRVVISIIFIIVVLLTISNEYRYSNLSAEFFAATLFFTSPCWLYWAGLWVWGEGFLKIIKERIIHFFRVIYTAFILVLTKIFNIGIVLFFLGIALMAMMGLYGSYQKSKDNAHQLIKKPDVVNNSSKELGATNIEQNKGAALPEGFVLDEKPQQNNHQKSESQPKPVTTPKSKKTAKPVEQLELSDDEKQSLEYACTSAKFKGPALYNRCVHQQYADLAKERAHEQKIIKSVPALQLTTDEVVSLKYACTSDMFKGPASYSRCLRTQLMALAKERVIKQ